MIKRKISDKLLLSLSDTPVVVLQGARQTGKSTLVQWLSDNGHPATYLTMDNITTLVAAQQDPVGFLEGLSGQNVILDEIQRLPELFLPIKAAVDKQRTPGRFLLTGSANALLMPSLTEFLVGRLESLTLWPLAQCELEKENGHSSSHFIDHIFSNNSLSIQQYQTSREDIITRALRGGYPEALARKTDRRRNDWLESYVTTLLQRDVRDLAQIQGLSELPLLLSLIAIRATAVLNTSELARSAKIPLTTLNRYLTLLQATFLVQLIPPWSTNLSKRLVKSPKLLLNDTGVLAALTGMSLPQFEVTPTMTGMLIENFVGAELIKLISWSDLRPDMFHFRTHDGKEVDFLLQDQAGRVIGIEVKAASSVQKSDFKGLHALSELLGDKFINGFVLYTGDTLLPFGPQMYAMPIATLWNSVEA